MKTLKTVFSIMAVLCLVTAPLFGGIQQNEHKTFSGKDTIKISTVSGDVIIKVGSTKQIVVDLKYDVTPKNAFDFVIQEQGSALRIKEKWYGRHSNGRVTWTLTVPAETKIKFETASGDFTASGLTNSVKVKTASGDIDLWDMKSDIDIRVASGDITLDNIEGDIEVSAASGDIDAENLKGDIELSTASGDIEIKDSKGIFDISCASGNLEADGIELENVSSFSTASGDVSVSLGKTTEYDLKISSASGDALLDYNGNTIKGKFELVARKRSGRIKCPFKFDHEEEYKKYDQKYMKKVFTKGSSSPVIQIRTASGTAELKK